MQLLVALSCQANQAVFLSAKSELYQQHLLGGADVVAMHVCLKTLLGKCQVAEMSSVVFT